MVRSFPVDIVPGTKLFAFGDEFGDSRAYTDDGSQYAEMWGGLTETFWDDTTLEARDEVLWQEYWYPAAHCGGVSMANERATLYVEPQDRQLDIYVYSPVAQAWRLVVSDGEDTIYEEHFAVDPESVYREEVALRTRNVGEEILVNVLDDRDDIVLAYTYTP